LIDGIEKIGITGEGLIGLDDVEKTNWQYPY
jgi:hypothetical protein